MLRKHNLNNELKQGPNRSSFFNSILKERIKEEKKEYAVPKVPQYEVSKPSTTKQRP